VQEFIAQARRTRDLWYGSHLLSELSRVVARALADGGAQLVFPALTSGDPELDPYPALVRRDGQPPRNIANKILAEVPEGIDPEKLARDARKAVMTHWRDHIAAPVKANCASLLADGIDPVWAEQIETFIEFAASWAPLHEYAEARRQVEQAVASRKVLRDFGPWVHSRGSVPKSSLDGARETVLLPPARRDPVLVRKYRIADGEQLDAVGLVKRTGGEPDQFVPVINVALASWIELAKRVAPKDLENLQVACSRVGVSRVARTDLPCAAVFPFDASVLLRSRWRAVFEEQGLTGDPQAWGRQHVQPLLASLSEPYPYVACLVADGDRMGVAIGQLGSASEHRTFSNALASFAGEARAIVEHEHRGTLIYAGGDDALAFLPIPEALSCAERLRTSFAEAMASACAKLADRERPTLSIGIGIEHYMESMGDLLALGREAEREAKRDRNTLALVVEKRSGGRRQWRAAWNDDPVRSLRAGLALMEDRLPSRKIYEIADMLARLPEPADGDDGWARVLELEVRRALMRIEGGGLKPNEVGLKLDDAPTYAASLAAARLWVDRLLIARTFANATPRQRRREEALA
jgi:CRISPR-associated protein Cmr2